MAHNAKFPAVFVPIAALLVFWLKIAAAPQPELFRFAILGDRTGDAQPGVYQQVWQEVATEDPAFVVTSGDTIEGMHDATAQAQWQANKRVLQPYSRYPLYLTPGNHDIWSAASERLFRAYAGHAPHYSFDWGQAHFIILDNSRSADFSAAELTFLEEDLKSHAAQPVKFIFAHRPSWLISVVLHNPSFPLHRLARQYGVQYVISGHVHQTLHLDLQDVSYISMPSSGGKLRGSKEDYALGSFFGHALVTVNGTDIDFHIEESKPPYGQGRISKPADWGLLGLVENR